MRRFGDYADAFASGWMQLRGTRRRRGVDRGFVLSDHADWPGLQQAIAGTGARARLRHARQRRGDGALAAARHGLDAQGFKTEYGDEDDAERAGRAGAGMKQFAALYRELDATTSSLAKQAALQRYLQGAAPADAAWAVYFLAGGKPRQLVPTKLLRQLAQEAAGLPEWLFDESYEAVGDLAETIALLLPPPDEAHDVGLAEWIEQQLLPLRRMPPEPLTDTAARAVAPAGRRRAPGLLQADHRRLSRRRVAAAGHAGAGGGRRRRRQARGAAADGLHARQRRSRRRRLRRADRAAKAPPSSTRRPAASPTPSFLRIRSTCRSRSSTQRSVRRRRLAGRMEVGRHPRPAGQARRPGVALVARRRAGDRPLSRTRADGPGLPDGTVLDGEIVVWRERPRCSPSPSCRSASAARRFGPKLLRDTAGVLLAYDLLERQGRDLRSAAAVANAGALLEALLADVQHPSPHRKPDGSMARAGTIWHGSARRRVPSASKA